MIIVTTSMGYMCLVVTGEYDWSFLDFSVVGLTRLKRREVVKNGFP